MSYDPHKITNPLHKDYKAPSGLDVTPFGSRVPFYLADVFLEDVSRHMRRVKSRGLL